MSFWTRLNSGLSSAGKIGEGAAPIVSLINPGAGVLLTMFLHSIATAQMAFPAESGAGKKAAVTTMTDAGAKALNMDVLDTDEKSKLIELLLKLQKAPGVPTPGK